MFWSPSSPTKPVTPVKERSSPPSAFSTPVKALPLTPSLQKQKSLREGGIVFEVDTPLGKAQVMEVEADETVSEETYTKLASFSRREALKRPAEGEPAGAPTPKKAKEGQGRFQWLVDVLDGQERAKTDKDYDPRTLHIPKDAWDRFTPFERQYWKIKATHFDTVVFFQKGKFYELYEDDADIGHQVFDLKMTERVNMRMVGVPVTKFDHWAAQFLAKGYRIAKCDERETALGKALREKETGAKGERIIGRDLSKVLTTGTLMYSDILTEDMAAYCLCIKERHPAESDGTGKYGICFVDAATAEFNFALLHDDRERTQLETLLIQLKPKEIIFEKGPLSKRTVQLLKHTSANADLIGLEPRTQFPEADFTRRAIGGYFTAERRLPAILEGFLEEDLLMCAFGGLAWWLKELKIDQELVEQGTFHTYDPLGGAGSLVLDGQTLMNLEVFANNTDYSEEGTLLKLVGHCSTPFGKRLFKQWLCHPLRNIEHINDRLDAIDDLTGAPQEREAVKGGLARVVDLERVVSRIQARAARVTDFLAALDSFRDLEKAVQTLRPLAKQFKSQRLRNLVATFPHLNEELAFFATAFNHQLAKQEGIVVPLPGADAGYDALCKQIAQIEGDMEKHLQQHRKALAYETLFFLSPLAATISLFFLFFSWTL